MQRLALLSIVTFMLAGCQSAQMRLDPALSAVAAIPVAGANPRTWNSPLSFGEWSTSEVREGLTWGFGYRLLGIEARYAQQPYRLVLQSGDRRIQAECMTRAVVVARHDLSVDPSLGNLPALSCGLRGAGEGTLRLRDTAANAQLGEVSFDTRIFTVRSVDRFVGSSIRSSEPIGYELMRGDRTMAAVETINAGRVWFARELSDEDRARVAAVVAVLLLYRPVEA